MSGTSGDGVDASIISSDGVSQYQVIEDKYFEYDNEIYQNIHNLKEKIHKAQDLERLKDELKDLERLITLFHVKVVKELTKGKLIDIIGFHGQTIYHNAEEKVSKQLGNGRLLSQLTETNIVNNFRQNDIQNGGEGAPLTPIFHQLITNQKKIELPVCILNIGGISNVTIITEPVGSFGFTSKDIGPGNCMIDSWIRKKTKKKFDRDGLLAAKGNVNNIIIEQAQELFSNRLNKKNLSFDSSDFDISFARGLSIEDGSATLTELTAKIIGASLLSSIKTSSNKILKVIVCGGGRKNKLLIKKIKINTLKNMTIQNIDEYGINGDFVESQGFAFLAIRSNLRLPISFPNTTGCEKPTIGGEIIKY